ncbi:MAG: hypothetical protein WCO52_03310 [bacterium]
MTISSFRRPGSALLTVLLVMMVVSTVTLLAIRRSAGTVRSVAQFDSAKVATDMAQSAIQEATLVLNNTDLLATNPLYGPVYGIGTPDDTHNPWIRYGPPYDPSIPHPVPATRTAISQDSTTFPYTLRRLYSGTKDCKPGESKYVYNMAGYNSSQSNTSYPVAIPTTGCSSQGYDMTVRSFVRLHMDDTPGHSVNTYPKFTLSDSEVPYNSDNAVWDAKPYNSGIIQSDPAAPSASNPFLILQIPYYNVYPDTVNKVMLVEMESAIGNRSDGKASLKLMWSSSLLNGTWYKLEFDDSHQRVQIPSNAKALAIAKSMASVAESPTYLVGDQVLILKAPLDPNFGTGNNLDARHADMIIETGSTKVEAIGFAFGVQRKLLLSIPHNPGSRKSVVDFSGAFDDDGFIK